MIKLHPLMPLCYAYSDSPACHWVKCPRDDIDFFRYWMDLQYGERILFLHPTTPFPPITDRPTFIFSRYPPPLQWTYLVHSIVFISGDYDDLHSLRFHYTKHRELSLPLEFGLDLDQTPRAPSVEEEFWSRIQGSLQPANP